MGILTKFVEYKRINWKNGKSGKTQLGASNLNIMDAGIKANNEAIAELNDVKLDKTEAELFAKKTDIPSALPADGGHADRATCDGNGNDITETYETKNGTELTRNMLKAKYFCGRTEEEEVYVGMLDSGLTGLLFQSDVIVPYGDIQGYAKEVDIPTKLAELTSDEGHRTVTDEQIAKWNNGADIPVATTTKDGLMSATDKIKLDSFKAAGMQIDNIKCLENTRTLEVSDSEMSGYDFVYFMIGSEYYGSSSTGDVVPWDVDGHYSTLIPVDWMSRMFSDDCVVNSRWYNGTKLLAFTIYRNGNNDGIVATGPYTEQTIIAWGIKIKGETASNVGGKVLAIETDTTASTYHISGNADTTPLILETVAYGSDGSVKDISSALAYVDGSGAVKLKTMATAISNTYGVVTTSSLGVISVSNKEGYKLKVWITGSGYTVTKQ